MTSSSVPDSVRNVSTSSSPSQASATWREALAAVADAERARGLDGLDPHAATVRFDQRRTQTSLSTAGMNE